MSLPTEKGEMVIDSKNSDSCRATSEAYQRQSIFLLFKEIQFKRSTKNTV